MLPIKSISDNISKAFISTFPCLAPNKDKAPMGATIPPTNMNPIIILLFIDVSISIYLIACSLKKKPTKFLNYSLAA